MSDLKVFKCPKCSQYINTSLNNCKFCNFELNDEIKQKAIVGEESENKLYRRSVSKKHLLAGIGILIAGLVLSLPGFLAGEIGDGGFIFIGLILIGLAETGNGIWGLLDG
jgi:hypothetical protein